MACEDGRVELTKVLLFKDRPAYGVARIAAAFPVANAERSYDAKPSLDIGGEFGEGLKVDDLIAAALAGDQWHNNVFRLVAHLGFARLERTARSCCRRGR